MKYTGNIKYVETLDDFRKSIVEFCPSLKKQTPNFETKNNKPEKTLKEKDDCVKNKNSLNRKYIYRGVSCVEQLQPTLIKSYEKHCADNSKTHSSEEFEKYEIDLLHNFETHGSYTLDNVTSVFDFLSTTRHYGLPSRLIDWTRNIYTAVLFSLFSDSKPEIACFSKECPQKCDKNCSKNCDKRKEWLGFCFDKYYYVFRIDISKHIRFIDIPSFVKGHAYKGYIMHDLPYAIKYTYMLETVKTLFKEENFYKRWELIDYIYQNTNSEYLYNLSHSNKKKIKRMRKYIKGTNKKIDKPDRILFVEPRQSNRRMAAQDGLFQFPTELDKEKIVGLILKNADVLAIKKDLRMEILTELKATRHDYFKLMPDLQGVIDYSIANTNNRFKFNNKEFF